ncbi:MAG: sugar MFS transporter [Sphingopyxis sp.]
MAAPIPNGAVTGSASIIKGNALPLLILVVAVFFLLGGVTNINDVLIPKLKGLFSLSNFEANLVQFAFFTSYALFSIPAGMLVARLGYMRSFTVGFLIVALGALMFIPAASSGVFISFLAALFVVGGGITLLQVGMNPVVIALGSPETAHSRLTFAQFFNSLGVFLMIYGGAELMLGKGSDVDPANLSGDALTQYRASESAVIGQAYFWVAAFLAAIALIFWLRRRALDHTKAEQVQLAGTWSLFTNNPRVRFGALCIFMYVGAEVAIGSNLITYLSGDAHVAGDGVMGIDALAAGKMLAYYWGGAMVGRLVGGLVLRALPAGRVLWAYATLAIIMIAISAFTSGALSGWTLVLVGFFNSLMFPTIFSLATEGLTDEAPKASGILCTAIVGGALVPPLFGLVTDHASIQLALIVPAICYAIIAAFGLWALKQSRTPA